MTKGKYLKYHLYILLGFIVLSIIVLSSVPPVSRDALTQHLAVPKLYLQHKGIYQIPSMKFSYYPMNLELLYMIPMYFGNDIVPKYIHFAFALMTAFIIYRYLKQRMDDVYGLLGALFFLSIPIIVKLSITAYVDLGLVFFSTASIILILKWAERGFNIRTLIYSAICCGLALGTKYNGLVVLFLTTVCIPILFLRGLYDSNEPINSENRRSLLKQSQALGYAIVFLIISILVFSPWMVRNYVWKKNPIYPMFHAIIRKHHNTPHAATQQKKNQSVSSYSKRSKLINKWEHFSTRRRIYKESWLEISLIPIRIFFYGKDDDPRYFDGKLNPLLFILPFFAFTYISGDSIRFQRETKLLLAFSVMFILYAFISKDMRIRYISPVIPPLVILSVIGLKKIFDRIDQKRSMIYKRVLKVTVIVSVLVLAMLNIFYMIDQFKDVKPFMYICSDVSRDTYISTYRAEYPMMQYANKHLSATSKILGIFMGNRRYYSDREIIFNNTFLIKQIKANASSKKIMDSLERRSFTHIMIWDRYFLQYANENFTQEELIHVQVFFKNYTKALYSSGGYTLFSIHKR